MGRSLQPATADVGDIDVVAPVNKGGTGGYTTDTVADSLSAISKNRLGINNGIANLGADGKLSANKMPKAAVNTSTIKGPSELTVGLSHTYVITNYDSKAPYNITVSAGSVSNIGSDITLIAPLTAQDIILTINGRAINIPVVPVRPSKPFITATTFGAQDKAGLVLSSSVFAMPAGVTSHKSSDWEVATDKDFINLVFTSYADLVNKLTITVKSLPLDTEFFFRVRHKDTTDVLGQWSNVNSVKTKLTYILNKEEAKLSSPDKSIYDYLGETVAINSDGSRVAVGTAFTDVNGVQNTGAVYIFARSGNSWNLEAKLVAADAEANISFGNSVHFDDAANRIVIGSEGNSPAGIYSAGAAYVFSRSGSVWTQEAKLTADDKATIDLFGLSVSMDASGSRVVVSSPLSDPSSFLDAGAAYVFTRVGTTWTQEAKLTAVDKQPHDQYGFSVALSADGLRIAVGSISSTSDAVVSAGAVYVYLRTGSVWNQEAKVTTADKAYGDNLGYCVRLNSDGTRLVTSAQRDDTNGVSDVGSVYIFTRSTITWSQEAKLSPPDGTANDYFGTSLSIDANGSRVVIGSTQADVDGIANCGAAYIYSRSGTSWIQENKLSASDKTADSYFGGAVALSADSTRLISSASDDDTGGFADAGCVYIFSN